MAKRKKIPASTRFEVFKRDGFKCQYCGRCAPEIVLEADHIEPHSLGGADDIINLITSCRDCNAGKSNKRLSDKSAVHKQRAQLEDLQERREQLEMMLRWRDAMAATSFDEVSIYAAERDKKTPGWCLNDKGKREAAKLIKKFGLKRCLDALDRAADMALKFGESGNATSESVEHLTRLTAVLAEPDDVQALFRIRARVRRRWNNVHDGVAIGLLRRLAKTGVTTSQIEEFCDRKMAERGTSFRWWADEMEDCIARVLANPEGYGAKGPTE